MDSNSCLPKISPQCSVSRIFKGDWIPAPGTSAYAFSKIVLTIFKAFISSAKLTLFRKKSPAPILSTSLACLDDAEHTVVSWSQSSARVGSGRHQFHFPPQYLSRLWSVSLETGSCVFPLRSWDCPSQPLHERFRTYWHYAEINGAVQVAVATTDFGSTIALDSLGRPYAQSGNNGQRLDMRYDNNGNLTSGVDAQGRVTSYQYDAANRLVHTTAPDGGVATMEDDSRGNLEPVTDPRPLQTRYTYNGFGQVTSVISPDTRTTTYVYGSAGRLTNETNAAGIVIQYAWDVLGRKTSRSRNGYVETFTYDQGTYGKGGLTRFNDDTGQTAYTYNAVGEIVLQVNSIYGGVHTTSWNYDAAGRLTSMSYPTGVVINCHDDIVGRIAYQSRSQGRHSRLIPVSAREWTAICLVF